MGVFRVLGALFAVLGELAFWLVIVCVIPGLIALYGARLFPLVRRARRDEQEPK